jgi:hypothetical protein
MLNNKKGKKEAYGSVDGHSTGFRSTVNPGGTSLLRGIEKL